MRKIENNIEKYFIFNLHCWYVFFRKFSGYVRNEHACFPNETITDDCYLHRVGHFSPKKTQQQHINEYSNKRITNTSLDYQQSIMIVAEI